MGDRFVSPQEAEDERKKLAELAAKKKKERELLKQKLQRQYEQKLERERERGPVYAEPIPTPPSRTGRGLPQRPKGGFKWGEPRAAPQRKKGPLVPGPTMPRPSMLPQTRDLSGMKRHKGGPQSITTKPQLKPYPKSKLEEWERAPRPSKTGRGFGPAGGKGWHFESARHAEARLKGGFPPHQVMPSAARTKFDFKKRIRSLGGKVRRRWGTSLDYAVARRLDQKVRAGEIKPSKTEPGKVIVFPTKKEKERGITKPRYMTVPQARLRAADELAVIHEGVKQGTIIYRPETGTIISDKGHPITYEYAYRQIMYIQKHPETTLQEARGKKGYIERRTAAGKKVRIKLPKKREYENYTDWLKRSSKKVEKAMDKVLPNNARPFQFNGRTIPANPKQKQFKSHKRLGKTYNIYVGVEETTDNAADIMANLGHIYDTYIGERLGKIIQANQRFYGKHFIRAKLNFLLHGTDGDNYEWNEQVRTLSMQAYQFFKSETLTAMMDGFKKLGPGSPQHCDEVKFVFIEITFVTNDPTDHW